MRLSVLFVLNPKHGVSTAQIRALIFKEILELRQWKATFVSYTRVKGLDSFNRIYKTEKEIVELAKNHDIVYLIKVNSLSLIKLIKLNTSSKVVFDLTDGLWRPGFRRAWFLLEEMLCNSDAVFCENEYVSDYAKRYNNQVFNLPQCTQPERFLKFREKYQSDSKLIRIGWIGSDSTSDAIVSLRQQLVSLFSKYSNLELRILGVSERRMARYFQGIRFSCLEVYNEEEMIQEAVKMDIGLFPAPSDREEYKVRGPLKALIYMSAGIPAVCLNEGEPAKIINDGINGVLICAEKEWQIKLEELILNRELRRKMGALGFETVKVKHTLENAFNELESAFSKVLSIERANELVNKRISTFEKLIKNIVNIPVFILADIKKLPQKIFR